MRRASDCSSSVSSMRPARPAAQRLARRSSAHRPASSPNENRRETTMAKAVTEARRPDATAGTDTIYRSLFDSFNPDKQGRISPLEVLSRLERSGLQPDDPRIDEALTGLAGADGGSRQINFTQFKTLARHNSSLIRRAVEGNLAVPDFASLTADIARMHDELLPLRSGAVAGYIPQLKRVDPDQLAIAVCTVDGQRFAVGDAATAFCLQSVSKT